MNKLREYQSSVISQIYAYWEGSAPTRVVECNTPPLPPTRVVECNTPPLPPTHHGIEQETGLSRHAVLDKVLLQLPTGGGKSVIFAEIVREHVNRGVRVLLLVHRTELINQANVHLGRATGVECGIIKSGVKPNYDRAIQIASVQSMSEKRMNEYDDFGLIVVDEAHHCSATTYRKVIDRYKGARLLGVTATPQRLDGKGLNDVFQQLVLGASVKYLIENKYLSSYKYLEPDQTFDLSTAVVARGEYTSESIEKSNPHQQVASMCLKAYQDNLMGKQTIVFATSVEQSKQIVEAFIKSGVPSCHLDGNSPDDYRSDSLTAFKSKQLSVMSNCQLFDEGLDIPGLDAVILAKPTKSLTKYLQQVGRSLRVSEGKDSAIIIDLCKNYEEHGMPNSDRQWSLLGKDKTKQPKKIYKRNEDGEIEFVADVIEPIKTTLSPNNFISVEERITDIRSSVIKNSSPSQLQNEEYMTNWINKLSDIIETKTNRNYKIGWVIHQLRNNNAPVEIYYALADHLNYKKGWAQYQYSLK